MTQNIHAASNATINRAVNKDTEKALREPAIEVLWRFTMNDNRERNMEYNTYLLRKYSMLTGDTWRYLCTIEQAIDALDKKVTRFLILNSMEEIN
jgi:hypothetical protein